MASRGTGPDQAPARRDLPPSSDRYGIRVVVSCDAVLDRRQDDVCHDLSLENTPSSFADLEFARATSRFIRRMTEIQALLALSMGFLADFGRRCLVVLLGRMPSDPGNFVPTVIECGPLR